MSSFSSVDPLFTNISYGNAWLSPSGGKNIKINSKSNNKWLQFQTPLMLTFGISDFISVENPEGNGKYSLSLMFPSEEYATPETNQFLENIKALENKVIDDALANAKSWFGPKVSYKSREILEALCTSCIKYSKDKDTKESDLNRPFINVKINKTKTGDWKTEIFGEEGNLLFPDSSNPEVSPLTLLPPKKVRNIAVVITCGGIWFANGKFNITFEAEQIVMQNQVERLLGKGKCLIQLKPSEKETQKMQQIEQEYNENEEEEEVADTGNISDGEEVDNEVGVDNLVKTEPDPENEELQVEDTKIEEVQEVVNTKNKKRSARK